MEMQKILSGNNLENVLNAMRHTNVLSAIGISGGDIDAAVQARNNNALPETVLAALAGNATAQVVDAWKLSRKERDTALFVAQHTNDRLHARDLEDWMKLAVEHGKDKVVQLLSLTNRTEFLDQMAGWKVPSFPVAGRDLIAAGHEPGPEMGATLRAMKRLWVDSGFTASKEDLMKGA